ncbi:MAG: RimK family alpha-L-glutamate ligase [Bacilli bacterium]|nr:RimK family alpha-L-glutamate ligase [Bacilli bacterium]
MATQGLVIVNAYEVFPSVSHMVKRLQEEFAFFGVDLAVKTSLDVLAIVGEEKKELPYSFAIFLDKDIYVASLLERRGLKLFNSSKAIWSTDDKMKTHLLLEGSGIKMPKTISAPLRYSKKENPNFLIKVMEELPFPVVAKENYGSQGKGVYLAENTQELRELESRLAFIPHLYQQVIASSKGRDFRIIVIGGKAIAWMERESQTGDFRSNIALGGIGKKIDLPQAFLETAEKAASILGLDYCGVDLLLGEEGEPILCEVNSNAFIQGIEQVTGINVAKAYATHILSKLGAC